MNIDNLIGEIDSENMDSNYENNLVSIFPELDESDSKKLIQAYLKHSDFQVRMLGLRLIKRVINEKDILEDIIGLSFDVERLTELQKWYSAILARYPVPRVMSRLKAEFINRKDSSFVERHKRALQIELAGKGVAITAEIKALLEESYS